MSAHVQLAVTVALAVSVITMTVHRVPPPDLARVASTSGVGRRVVSEDEDADLGESARNWSWFFGWAGAAFALLAVVGFESFPSLRVAWFVVLGVSGATVPITILLALVGELRSRKRTTEHL